MLYNRVTAVVLAGGGSTRMGQDKALLKLGNKTMLERIVESLQIIFEKIVIVTNHSISYDYLSNVIFVKDIVEVEKKNSLIGLYSGLKQSETDMIFVVGCDMPFVNTELIEYMIRIAEDSDVVVPKINGFYEPLYAIYSKNCIAELEKLIAEKNYRISSLFDNVNTRTIGANDILAFNPSMDCFRNINTYNEYIELDGNFQ